MNQCRRICLVIALCFILSACVQTIKKPEWKFEEATIHVHIRADRLLNLFNNESHTLYVCFYQLSDRNTFDQLTQNANGIRKLLECRMFDSSVTAVTDKVIRAGDNITLTLDRAEGTQYFAVVTGYSGELSASRMVRCQEIQVRKKRVSLFKNEYQCIPCALHMELVLGPDQIESAKLLVTDKGCADECR
jgi:predicted component of type VI protein secretion system